MCAPEEDRTRDCCPEWLKAAFRPQAGLHYFRVGKGELPEGVRQECALFPRGLQEKESGLGQDDCQGNAGVSGSRAKVQDPSGERGKAKQEQGVQNVLDA